MIKDLKNITSIVFEFSFPSGTILSFFLLFFIFHLYFLITAVIAQVFISTAGLVIPTVTQTNKAKAEIETQPVTAEAKISKSSA